MSVMESEAGKRVAPAVPVRWAQAFRRLGSWVDSSAAEDLRTSAQRVAWLRVIPFIALHLACLGIIWVGASTIATIMAILLYVVRMFAITGFYHRYFSHRSFRTSRAAQFVFAALGNLAVQRGALWWASVHRHHHRFADHDSDVHSPARQGFWWSHIGWMTS